MRVDPAVVLGQQRGDGGADVVGQAGPAERGDAGDEGVDLLVVAHRAAAEIGFDRAGGDRVDRDAARPELLGEVARQHFDRALHRRIGRIAGQGEAREAARDIHDPAAVGDQRQQRLGEEEHAFEMDVHQPVEIGFGRFGERRVDADAGVVDEEVEVRAAPLGRQRLFQIGGESGEAGDVARVELEHRRLAPERRDRRRRRVGLGLVAVIRADHVDALARQRDRHVAA